MKNAYIHLKIILFYTFIFMLNKKHTRTLFYMKGYQGSYSGYFLSFTSVELLNYSVNKTSGM